MERSTKEKITKFLFFTNLSYQLSIWYGKTRSPSNTKKTLKIRIYCWKAGCGVKKTNRSLKIEKTF